MTTEKTFKVSLFDYPRYIHEQASIDDNWEVKKEERNEEVIYTLWHNGEAIINYGHYYGWGLGSVAHYPYIRESHLDALRDLLGPHFELCYPFEIGETVI